MGATTRWWWIRHAPVRHHGGRLYGRKDVSCDTSDGPAIRALAARLPDGALWITSPLKRTTETAAALAGAMRAAGRKAAEPVIEPSLIEQDFGAWQGLTFAEIDAALGASRHNFWFAPAGVTPPGGESFAAVAERVAATVRRLTAAHRGRDIVAVGHGGTVRAALALALEVGAEAALRFAVDTLSLTRIDHFDEPGTGGAWCVRAVNLSPPY